MRRLKHFIAPLAAVAVLWSGSACAIDALSLPAPLPKGVYSKRQSLPVLSAPANVDELCKQNVVTLSDGVNEIVYVSMNSPNRIATPFSKPSVVSVSNPGPDSGKDEKEDDSYQYVGQDVYVVPTQTTPYGIFIYDKSRTGGPVASLTLVPQNIPIQNIVIRFDQATSVVARGEQETENVPSDYVDQLRSIMRSIAQGASPYGYTDARLDVGKMLVGGLSITPLYQYIGGRLTIYKYRIDNVSPEVVELSEPSFYEEGVRAVAFWPIVRLEPGASSYVLIAADPDRSGSKQ